MIIVTLIHEFVFLPLVFSLPSRQSPLFPMMFFEETFQKKKYYAGCTSSNVLGYKRLQVSFK